MINERNMKLGTEIIEGKADKYQNKDNNSDSNNYLQRIKVNLRVSGYKNKYRRLVNKLNIWTQQIQDANVFIDLAIDKNFDYKLREICNNLEKGKEQLVDKIKRGRIKDKKLMEISLNVHDDIVMTLKRWNDVKNEKKLRALEAVFLKIEIIIEGLIKILLIIIVGIVKIIIKMDLIYLGSMMILV